MPSSTLGAPVSLHCKIKLSGAFRWTVETRISCKEYQGARGASLGGFFSPLIALEKGSPAGRALEASADETQAPDLRVRSILG